MLVRARQILELLCCPRCRSKLYAEAKPRLLLVCENQKCNLSGKPFLSITDQPILIDFDESVVSEEEFKTRDGASYKERDDGANSLQARFFRVIFGKNRTAIKFLPVFVTDLKACADKPRILIIGGGSIGAGTAELYFDEAIELIGTDIYVSANTTFVADGHRLPLADESVDGVWIQAVLEHVLDPNQVVSEIYRVLKPHGLVFADTPFMMQVHEGAYDFTRFTLSGHRWLFRHFELIDAGVSGGPGTAASWALRYLVRAVVRNDKISTAVQIGFFWLRYFDYLPASRTSADATSAVFFYGRKADAPITPRGIVEFYETLQ